jgi:5'-nucleotidase
MRLLLTNDDGIDAPGLAALEAAARDFGEVLVVAPAAVHSGCGHRVTTDSPLRLCEYGPRRFSLEGTPADCVRVALHGLVPEIDWVLSGINAGGNLGADVHHSGTVAAVREAVLHGRPGVALSHYRRRGLAVEWDRAASWARRVLRELLARSAEPGAYWNVNLPHLDPSAADPPVVFCPLDPGPLPLSYRREGDLFHYDGDYHGRPRVTGADVDVCFRGQIAVTRLSLL